MKRRSSTRDTRNSKKQKYNKNKTKNNSFGLKEIGLLLKNNQFKNIIVMGGAGISTSSGIPDFRSEKGIYKNGKDFGVEQIEAKKIFDLKFFQENPAPLFKVLKKFLIEKEKYQPTKTHKFIKILQEKNILLRVYTQNFDALEKKVGICPENIIYCHGCLETSICTKCSKKYETDFITTNLVNDEIPKCKKKNCDGIIRPEIILFGEALSDRFEDFSSKDFTDCDLLIIFGTSLKVNPFRSLIETVNKNVPRLLINNEIVCQSDEDEAELDLFRRGMFLVSNSLHIINFLFNVDIDTGFRFDLSTNTRDYKWIGNCDDACEKLVKLCEWENELI